MKLKIEFSKKCSRAFDIENAASKVLNEAATHSSRVGVACSGGADSVFLLYLVMSALGRKNLSQIRVLHFNHKARANAEIDEAFVRGLCERFGLEFVSGAPVNPPKNFTEDEFRKMRLEFFSREFFELKLEAIFQGHHCGDVAESLLMRAMRGAGLDGLCAPRAVSKVGECVFARPMLGIKKSEIVSALREAAIDWREDESNAGTKFLRNRIRNILIPEIEKIIATDFLASAKRSHDLLAEDADFITQVFASKMRELNGDDALCATSLKFDDQSLATPSIVRRAAETVLSNAGASVRAASVDAFVARVSGGSQSFKTSAGECGFLCFDASYKTIFVAKSNPDFEIPLEIGKNVMPDGGVLTVKRVTLSPAAKKSLLEGGNDDSKSVYLEMSAAGTFCDGALTARNKRDGDAYAPIGSKSKKRVKDIFIAKKISFAKRNSVPLVLNKAGDILWGVGLPPCDKFKIKNSLVAIELTYEPPIY